MSGKPTFSQPRPPKREQRGKPALHKCIYIHHGVDRDSVGLGSSRSVVWDYSQAGLGGGVEWAGEGTQNSLADK